LKLRHAWHIEARLRVAKIKKFIISRVAVGGSLKTQPRVATHRKLSTRGSSSRLGSTLKLCHAWHLEARLRVAHQSSTTRGTSKLDYAWHIEAQLRMADQSSTTRGTSKLDYLLIIEARLRVAVY